MSKILLGTNNYGKQIEMQALLAGLAMDLVTPDDLGIELHVVEDGQTYQENAALKAIAFAEASGMLALADDSGLEVAVLGGLPGLRSARFAPIEGATDADRRMFLLERLAGKPRPWRAQFRCLVALARPGEGVIHFTEGICPGEIVPVERGTGGFGYDPIFLLPELGRTMAELSMREKNEVSHRARAVKAAREWLEKSG